MLPKSSNVLRGTETFYGVGNHSFCKQITFVDIDLFTYYCFYTVVNKRFSPFAVIWTISLVMNCINFNRVLGKRGTRGHDLTPGRFTLTFNCKTSWCLQLPPVSGGVSGKKCQVLIII